MDHFTLTSQSRRARRWVGATVVAILSCFVACSYDENNRCGDELVFENGVCVCPEGAVLIESTCVACEANEVPTASGCECAEGFSRPDANADCEEDDLVSGSGGEAGASNSDAGNDDGPPEGIGQSCESSADCAGTDATYCETFMTGTCMVEGCNLDVDDCYEGYECCDLTTFGLPVLCVSTGDCPT